MAIEAIEALTFFIFVLPIAIWAAWSDLKFMTVPNMSVLALAGVFGVLGLLFLPLDAYLWRLAQAGIVLVIGFVFNMLRILGAGDAKFGAAMALYVAAADASGVFLLLALCLMAAFATHRIARRIPPLRRATADWASWSDREFPMGFALASCLLIYLGLGAAFGV